MKKNSQLALALIIFISAVISTGFKDKTIVLQSNDLKTSMVRGQELYLANCISCHMKTGVGIKSVFPPLAESDYLMADIPRSIKQILNGAQGEVTVNGVVYNGVMTSFDLKDQEVADILNYIRNSWGNKGRLIKAEEVKKERV